MKTRTRYDRLAATFHDLTVKFDGPELRHRWERVLRFAGWTAEEFKAETDARLTFLCVSG